MVYDGEQRCRHWPGQSKQNSRGKIKRSPWRYCGPRQASTHHLFRMDEQTSLCGVTAAEANTFDLAKLRKIQTIIKRLSPGKERTGGREEG